ncbi:MAG: ribosome-associated translation inhibitor RaiA [Synergistetes bacterium]|nr:ribosome-associated translation inhibitor RaiA [Synergistota bacterium]
MDIQIVGRNVEATDILKNYISKKVEKLKRYFDRILKAQVILSTQRGRYFVEVTLNANGVMIRGEEAAADFRTATDAVMDKIERQLKRFKGKLVKKYRMRVPEQPAVSIDDLKQDITPSEKIEEEEPKIVKVKKISFKPMSPEEAVLQMELVGHDFFVFTNDKTEEVNVVYKRKDGNYGLIEPGE